MSAWTRFRTRVANSTTAKRLARIYVIAFAGVALPGSLGWLHQLTEWSSSEGQRPFPDAHSLAFLGVSAVVAGGVAVLNGLVLALEDYTGKAIGRDVPPPPPNP